MKVCVIGATGMLGHVVRRRLAETGHTVLVVERRFSALTVREWLGEVMSLSPDWCINCAFVRTDPGGSSALDVNLLLPVLLARALPPEIGVIQAGSDAVFAPGNGGCAPDAPPDAVDEYGLVKRFVETAFQGSNRYVLRCSIIGPDLAAPRNLLSWYLSRTTPVSGYLNQLWNGISTLEWAKICERIISGSLVPHTTIQQPGVLPPISKYDLLKTIGNVWQHAIPVIPVSAEKNVSRYLIPSIECPTLVEQLQELHAWYRGASPTG